MRIALLPQTTIPAAETYTTDPVKIGRAMALMMQSKFVRAAGGTTVKAYLQTSLDGGVTYFDIINHAYATTTATKVSAVTPLIAPAAQGLTPLDGTLTDNTIIQGVVGDLIRLKYVVVGTYTGASHLTVHVVTV